MTFGLPPQSFPLLQQRLLDLNAITRAEAATLAEHLSIATFSDLQVGLDDGRISRGMVPETASRLRAVLDRLSLSRSHIGLGRAFDLLETVRAQLQRTAPELQDLTIAGDARRYEPLVHELVIVSRASNPPSAIEAICEAPWVESVALRTARRALICVQQHEIDIRVAAPDEFGTVLFLATGTHEHIQAVTGGGGIRTFSSREEDVYAQQGLAWTPPELRHNGGEVEAARTGHLPRLVESSDIRGDLHLHTTYSDGQDTLETMLNASVALGYEYIAVTDHSENAGASRTVTQDALLRQRDEIARMRVRYPQIEILHGIEVDILPNGRLDFPDAVLESLDIVLASLHDSAQQGRETLTRRCLDAMAHPLVNVVTHPANQLPGRRAGYDLDYPAIYAAAAESGTALEIDGAPSHLDLDGEHAREAVAAGVTLTIDSDCHRARALGRQMDFGVGTARRGWVEARQVLNTRPVAAVRAFVAAKRRR